MSFFRRVVPVVSILIMQVPGAFAEESSPAPSPEKTKLINELFEVSPYKSQIDTMLDSVVGVLAANIQKNIQLNLAKDGKMTADEAKEQAVILTDKIMKNFKKRLNLQSEMLTVFSTTYSKHFSEQELKDMIAFNKSPVGQKSKDKIPLLVAETSARLKQRLDPKVNSMMRAKLTELEKQQPPEEPEPAATKSQSSAPEAAK